MSVSFNDVRNLAHLRKIMRNCEQTHQSSVLDHGIQVARYFEDLRSHVMDGTPLRYEWRLPDWVYDQALWLRVLPIRTVRQYQIYHDCSKPFCRVLGDDGRRHFPDHAALSGQLWRYLSGDEQISRLMERDMDIHLMKSEGVAQFSLLPEAATLLLTGLSEVHANAAMFGGIESTSYKIKYKQINKRGKAVLSCFLTNREVA